MSAVRYHAHSVESQSDSHFEQLQQACKGKEISRRTYPNLGVDRYAEVLMKGEQVAGAFIYASSLQSPNLQHGLPGGLEVKAIVVVEEKGSTFCLHMLVDRIKKIAKAWTKSCRVSTVYGIFSEEAPCVAVLKEQGFKAERTYRRRDGQGKDVLLCYSLDSAKRKREPKASPKKKAKQTSPEVKLAAEFVMPHKQNFAEVEAGAKTCELIINDSTGKKIAVGSLIGFTYKGKTLRCRVTDVEDAPGILPAVQRIGFEKFMPSEHSEKKVIDTYDRVYPLGKRAVRHGVRVVTFSLVD